MTYDKPLPKFMLSAESNEAFVLVEDDKYALKEIVDILPNGPYDTFSYRKLLDNGCVECCERECRIAENARREHRASVKSEVPHNIKHKNNAYERKTNHEWKRGERTDTRWR